MIGVMPDSIVLYSKERMQEIVAQLTGSTMSVEALLDDGEVVTAQLKAYINEHVFECEQCGWWCEIEEMHNEDGNERCEDCAE